jgi:hypothetical protein
MRLTDELLDTGWRVLIWIVVLVWYARLQCYQVHTLQALMVYVITHLACRAPGKSVNSVNEPLCEYKILHNKTKHFHHI